MNWDLIAHTVGPLAIFGVSVFFADNVRNFVKGIPADIAAGADSVWDRVVLDSKAAASKVVADAKSKLAPTLVAVPNTVLQPVTEASLQRAALAAAPAAAPVAAA